MARRADAADLVRTLPVPNLVKRGRGEGGLVEVYDLSFRWKVKADETGSRFSIYEMTIVPGTEIPIHTHPFPEFFYALDGQIDVMGMSDDGTLTWTPVMAGECANAPSNAPHGIRNRTDQPAKFLSVSTPEHERMFNEYQSFLQTSEGKDASDEQKSRAFTEICAKLQITYLDVP